MKRFLFIMICLILSSVSYADQDAYRFGLMPSYSVFNLNDPSGPTDKANNLSLLSGVMFIDAGRDSRLFANLAYDKFSVKATTSNIAQDVTRLGGNISYQTMLRITRDWKPWLGIGLGEASEAYKNRYTVTPTGFSVPVNPSERNVNNVFFLVNASSEWQINRAWSAGIHFQYEQPMGEGSQVLKLGVYAVY